MKKLKIFVLATACALNIFVSSFYVFALERISLKLTYNGSEHEYENYALTLNVNGDKITELPMPPVIIGDYTYVPVREIFTALGAVVDWNDYTKEIYIAIGGKMIVLQINNPVINNDGRLISIPVAPMIINDKTMVPLRFAVEGFGFLVEWNDSTKTIDVFSDDYFDDKNGGLIEDEPDESDSDEPADSDSKTGDSESPNITSDTELYMPEQNGRPVDISPMTIESKDFPETKIVSLTEISMNSYEIKASSEISEVKKSLLDDDRLVIDIYDAELALLSLPETINNPYVDIRIAQNQLIPRKITRIVFDIKTAINYSVVLSADRKSLTFSYERNYVSSMKLTTDGEYDYLRLGCRFAPVMTVFTLSDPLRLVIDLPSNVMYTTSESGTNGLVAYNLRAAQFEPDTARVVLDLRHPVNYTVHYEDTAVVIRLSPVLGTESSGYNFYNPNTKTISIPKDPKNTFDINAITHLDLYNQLRYILSFPTKLTTIDSGIVSIKDDYLNTAEIYTEGGRTYIALNETRVLAYTVTEDTENIYIKAMLPREKYPFIVVLDPGHGGKAVGAMKNGLVETDLTFDIVSRTIELIEADNLIKVYSTRLEDIDVDLSARAEFGNEIGDIFVSVHINSFTNSGAHGTEVWYYPHSNDSTIGITSAKIAGIMQKNLLSWLGTFDRKIKQERFVVLNETIIPSVLCEIEFISNPDAAANLASTSFRQKAANAIYQSILEVSQIYKPKR